MRLGLLLKNQRVNEQKKLCVNGPACLSLKHRFMFQPLAQGSAGIAVLALDLQPEAMCEREKSGEKINP